MSTRPRTAVGGVALLLALTGTAYAVGSTMGSSPARAEVRLPAFADCDELTKRMSTIAMPYVNPYGIGPVLDSDGGWMPLSGRTFTGGDEALSGMAGADAAAAGPAAAGQSAGESSAQSSAESSAARAAAPPMPASDAYAERNSADADDAVGPGKTGTNLQEAGVDEPDVAKTDGRYVYSLDDGTLRIVDVSGDSPRTLGSLRLAERGIRPTEMLLAGDRALVLGTTAPQGARSYMPQGDARVAGWDVAVLALIDLSDRDNPRLLASEEITGRQVSARMTGDTVRVVLSSTPELSFRRPSGYSSGDAARTDDAALEFNKDVVRYAKASDWLPSRTIVDGSGRITAPPAPLVDCADVRYPTEDSGLDMLSVLTLDLGRDDALQTATSTAVVTAGDLVYASPDRLYVATTQGGWGGIDGFEMRRFGGSDAVGGTAVHEFDITDPARTVYRSSGTVAGYIPGRWAISEYEGNLRVVTTSRTPWMRDGSGGGGEIVSNIVVLRPRRDRLVQVGAVSGLGRGETVRAVRWFDELAAVVTFRQTDPLYLVDMSVPESPVVRGELKIPGYSAYLHPIGDHRLLGVGQDATETGQELGLQVSSFDISDADHPRQTDKVTYGQGSSSPVQTDARGFVYLPDRRTAVLPATLAGGGADMIGACPPGARCTWPERGMEQGLISVTVGQDGRLAKAGAWGDGYSGMVGKVLSLPGGRLAALTDDGVAVLDADGLTERGSTHY